MEQGKRENGAGQEGEWSREKRGSGAGKKRGSGAGKRGEVEQGKRVTAAGNKGKWSRERWLMEWGIKVGGVGEEGE